MTRRIIVGNTFAAFTVITAGIGVPFVIALLMYLWAF